MNLTAASAKPKGSASFRIPLSSPSPFGGSLYGNLVFALGILDFLRVRGFLFRNFRLGILEFLKIRHCERSEAISFIKH